MLIIGDEKSKMLRVDGPFFELFNEVVNGPF